MLSAVTLAENPAAHWRRSCLATIKRLRPEDAAYKQLEAWCRVLLQAGQYDQLNLGGNACLKGVARQILSDVDVHSDASIVPWEDAKHYTSRMTVPAWREDVARRVRGKHAEDPGVRRAWTKQKAPTQTTDSLAAPLFPDDGSGGHPKGRCVQRAPDGA